MLAQYVKEGVGEGAAQLGDADKIRAAFIGFVRRFGGFPDRPVQAFNRIRGVAAYMISPIAMVDGSTFGFDRLAIAGPAFMVRPFAGGLRSIDLKSGDVPVRPVD